MSAKPVLQDKQPQGRFQKRLGSAQMRRNLAYKGSFTQANNCYMINSESSEHRLASPDQALKPININESSAAGTV